MSPWWKWNLRGRKRKENKVEKTTQKSESSVSSPGKHNLLCRLGRLKYFIYACVCARTVRTPHDDYYYCTALHNAHIFRHRFILISINITHYFYCYVCCWLYSLCVTVVFVLVTCSVFAEWRPTKWKKSTTAKRQQQRTHLWYIQWIFSYCEHFNGSHCRVCRWKRSKGKWVATKKICLTPKMSARGLPSIYAMTC